MRNDDKATPTLIKGKVTSEALRKMKIGQTVTFETPDAQSIDIGKTIAYRIQHYENCKITAVSDYANHRLTITKSARP